MNPPSPITAPVEPLPDECTSPDPYDGVALGVECAWPIDGSGAPA